MNTTQTNPTKTQDLAFWEAEMEWCSLGVDRATTTEERINWRRALNTATEQYNRIYEQ